MRTLRVLSSEQRSTTTMHQSGATPARSQETEQIPVDFTRASALTAEVSKEIDLAFEYAPWSSEQTSRGTLVRTALAAAAKSIVANVPPCPDRTAALRELRDARMWCNSAITHNGKY
jgi:hypothetical protein